jgi:hypothetical protein
MGYDQLLLALWLADARLYAEGAGLRIVAPLTDELRIAIRRHRPQLVELARRAGEDGRLQLPARDYLAVLWAPRAGWSEWRTRGAA